MGSAGLACALLLAAVAPARVNTTDPRVSAGRDPSGGGVRLAFGLGAAGRSVASQSNAALPLELSLVMNPFLTASVGAVLSEGRVAHAYGEVGVYFLVSVGVGIGYGAYRAGQGVQEGSTSHLFVGLPIPLHSPADFVDAPWGVYLLPYYRPSWGPWPGTAHEGGLMIKVSYGLLRGSVFGG